LISHDGYVNIFVVNIFVGMIAGANNKYHFARPASAKHAADILGTTPEELSRVIFSQGPPSQSLSPAYRLPARQLLFEKIFRMIDIRWEMCSRMDPRRHPSWH